MNREELFAAVAADLNREDKMDRLPQWLESAEFRINAALRDERMVKRAVLEITETTFPVPPDFIEPQTTTIRHHITDPVRPGEVVGAAKYMPPDQIDDGWSTPLPNAPRGPLWYTMRGRNFELGNWNAEGPFQVDLWYYANLMKLVEPTDTNFLLTIAPHIYVDAMSHFGFRHLQEFDNADRCLVSMTAEIQFLNDKNEATKFKGPLIARPTRGFGASPRSRRSR